MIIPDQGCARVCTGSGAEQARVSGDRSSSILAEVRRKDRCGGLGQRSIQGEGSGLVPSPSCGGPAPSQGVGGEKGRGRSRPHDGGRVERRRAPGGRADRWSGGVVGRGGAGRERTWPLALVRGALHPAGPGSIPADGVGGTRRGRGRSRPYDGARGRAEGGARWGAQAGGALRRIVRRGSWTSRPNRRTRPAMALPGPVTMKVRTPSA